MLLKQRLQGVKKQQRRNQFDICIPGNEIPEWFNCRSDENLVKIGLPSNWLNDEFMGIAMCGVFTPDLKDLDGIKEYALCCMSIIGNGYQFSSGPRRYPTLESDHLWLTYMPRELFEHDRSLTLENEHLRSSEYEYDSTNSVLVSTSTCIHARFNVVCTSGVHVNAKVIKSGIRLVYKRDIECSEDDLLATDASILHQHHNCSTFHGTTLTFHSTHFPSLLQEWWGTQ